VVDGDDELLAAVAGDDVGGADRSAHGAGERLEGLVARGVPMRSAHEAVGKLVRLGEERGRKLAELPAEAFDSVQPGLAADVYQVLGVRNALAAFRSAGSTAPAEVARQLAFWRERLAADGRAAAAAGK
jgi:argininosuccinate lyase